MPGESFLYHVTRSPLGLLFNNYDYRSSMLLNDIIQQTLVEAGHKINQQLAQNPALRDQAVDHNWFYFQEEHRPVLNFTPDSPDMTYGNILIIIPLISTWATKHIHPSNLPNMPGPFGATFSYHMTPSNHLGLVFAHYDYRYTIDNDLFEQIIVGATDQYYGQIAEDPTRANLTVVGGWYYDHPPHGESEEHYFLGIFPMGAEMRYRDIPRVFALLEDWGTQYQAVDTDYNIYERPGSGEQRRLGYGNIGLTTPG
ncbi:MAG: hypothetical protein Q9216_002029 [Gyalolechia sp. 2 TL-2023]